MLTDDDSTPTSAELKTEAAQEGKDSKTRHLIVALVAGLIIFALLGLGAWGYVWWSQVQAGSTLANQVTTACQNGKLPPTDRLCTQAKEVTKVVEEGPVGATGEEGKQGEKGEKGDPGKPGPGPTAAQVSRAVSTYCADDRCVGKPTANQVLAAVSVYCADGSCDGEDGADSTVAGPQGEQGPAPTDEQILAAVSTYCADGRCKGEKGDKGDQGDAGTPAYPFSWTYTIPGQPPVSQDRTYHVVCETPGTECVVTETTAQEPQEP